VDRPAAAGAHLAAAPGALACFWSRRNTAELSGPVSLGLGQAHVRGGARAPQVPAGVPLPDYAETATPTSELENKQQRIGAPRPGGRRRRQAALAPSRAELRRLTRGAPRRAVPIRTAAEIKGLRAACTLAREVLDKAHAAVRPGVTTDEIDRVVRAAPRCAAPRCAAPRCMALREGFRQPGCILG